jgi:hypothetical protein
MITNKLNKINLYIIKLNTSLYNSIYNIANPTLSRNPYMSNFLDYYLGNKTIKKITIFKKSKLILKYYCQFYIRFIFYFLKYITYNIFRKKDLEEKDSDYIIDVNFIVKDIIKNNEYKDTYFKDLDKKLEKFGFKTTYLVKSFIGSEFNLYQFYNMIKVLNTSDKRILSEFDLLSLIDLLKIFYHSNIYPFKLMSIKVSTGDSFVDKVIMTSNIEALNSSAFTRFVRYYVGIKLAKSFKNTQLISNCEYKCHDKIFYKGIKETNKNIFIYGCQFFIDYPVWLNTKIPKEEEKFNVTPDVVLTNGVIDLNKHGIDTKKGVSLRYDFLFNNQIYLDTSKQILILLSFEKTISKHILDTCSKSKYIKDYKVIIRPHPVLDIEQFRDNIQENWLIDSTTSLEKQFEDSSLVIVSGSGSAIEAAVKGKSIVVIGSKDTFITNPLSDTLGKGVLWEEAYSSDELDKAISILMDVRKNKIESIEIIANEYLKQYFIEPSDENIKQCFIAKKEKMI